MDLYDREPWLTEWAHETDAGYLPPSVVPRWSASSLRHSSHGRAGRATQPAELRLQSVSPVRRPDSPLAHASNEQVAPQDHEPDHRRRAEPQEES